MTRAWQIAFVVLLGLAQPALAGLPFASDDPEPTDYKHFEIYTFNSGTCICAGAAPPESISTTGAAPNLQLTVTFPVGFESPVGAATSAGVSNIELAAKYRFLRQDTFGWDVSVFPRVFLPSPTGTVGDSEASLLLPIWLQRDWGHGWTTFGGGGCTFSPTSAKDFCEAGAVLTKQILPKLQLGLELFHQTADATGTPASTSLGVGMTYDINDTYHVLGYVRRGIENADQTDRYSWYGALLTTF